MNSDRIKNIQRYGKTAQGQKELIKHLSGQRLTFKQAIYAKCYDCMNYFSDGKNDCSIPACSLHPFMAYNQNREKRNTKKTMPGEHMEKVHAAMP